MDSNATSQKHPEDHTGQVVAGFLFVFVPMTLMTVSYFGLLPIEFVISELALVPVVAAVVGGIAFGILLRRMDHFPNTVKSIFVYLVIGFILYLPALGAHVYFLEYSYSIVFWLNFFVGYGMYYLFDLHRLERKQTTA